MAARRRPQKQNSEKDLAAQVLALLGKRGRPALGLRALADALGRRRGVAKTLRRVLAGLVKTGQLEAEEGLFRVPRADGLVEGVFEPAGPPAAGGGVVCDAKGRRWSVPESGDARRGDQVLVQPIFEAERGTGEIVEILAGSRSEWIGILHHGRASDVVTPYRDELRWRVHVAHSDRGGARNGEVVAVVPAARARRGGDPWGEVSECLGFPGDAEADFRAVVWRRRLPVRFAPAVMAEAEAVAAQVGPAERAGRLDLRDRCFLTIDPADARDHDDAVCVEATASGATRLWVAIADVAHFVREGSAIDREALNRGNSVYFPDRAIPMLPEKLSGDVCSLKPDVDRLVLAVELDIEADGAVTDARFHRAVVRSRARLSYPQAAAVMETGGEPGPAAIVEPEVATQLRRLAEVAQGLMQRRLVAGALDFDLPAPEVVLDEQRRPLDIVRSARSLAHRAVEEAMLAANRAVARALSKGRAATVYRVHEPPAPQKLEELQALYASFGLGPGGAQPKTLSSAQIALALRRSEGRPEERLVHLATLRAMRQARYCADDLGHFALAFESYLHFTSPIRRYADLVAHRALCRLIEGESAARSPAGHERMQRIAVRTSARERLAMLAEREMLDLKKCAFMRERIGEELDGVVTGVAEHGLYVTPDDFFVEGLLPVAALPGYFELDARAHALVARRSGQRHRLGDRLRVRVERVDPVKGWINFALVDDPKQKTAEGARAPAREKDPKPGRRSAPERRRGRRARR